MSSINTELTIAVTGVGAIIGQGIVRSLRSSSRSLRIVGVDRNERSPGTSMVDVFEKKLRVPEDDPAYLDNWEKIICRHGVALVLPGLEVDMVFLDRHRARFESLGAVLALNTPELIGLTRNKWLFGQALALTGGPQIPSARPESWGEALNALGSPPLLFKPLQGNGSRGIVRLDNERDFEYWRQKMPHEWMLQRIVGSDDQEYTVGVFGFGDGRYLGPIVFRRRLSGAGNTQEAEVVQGYEVIESAVKRLCLHFRPKGPTNLQFRVENGIAFLLEINPRFSSSNSLRTAFGFNEAEMSVTFYHDGILPDMPVIRAGIAWRYYEDYVSYAGRTV